jgi:hypothetical protein
MRRLAALKKRRKFDGHWYELDYTAEKVYWWEFDRRLSQVKARGWQYRVITKTYPQFGVYKALYIKR